MTPEATCTRCRLLKPATAFYGNAAARNGLMSRCRDCIVEVRAQKRDAPKTTPAELKCTRCDLVQPAAEFPVNRNNTTGLQNYCKACSRRQYQANRHRLIEYQRQHRWEDARVRMASDARRSDRRHGRESDIQARDIVLPRVCPVTGGPIYHGFGVRMAWSPCLERIDKSRGFVRGNWRVVSWESVEAFRMSNCG